MQQLTWIKCQGEVWCKLNAVRLEHEHFNNRHGVYLIWHGGPAPATLKVGHGLIRDRLTQERTNPEVQKFDNLGLFATWAAVPNEQIDGVLAFLAQKLNPIIKNPITPAVAIEVNVPW